MVIKVQFFKYNDISIINVKYEACIGFGTKTNIIGKGVEFSYVKALKSLPGFFSMSEFAILYTWK